MAEGQKIAEIRIGKKMSIAALARAAQVTRPTVYAAESGKNVDLDTLVRIAAALEVPLVEIAPDAAKVVEAVA